MIPILYSENEKAYMDRGLGALSDSISCLVTEERNGIFELEMSYPVSGIHSDEIMLSRIIMARPAVNKDPEPFRIYKITKPLNGIYTVYAEHISYQLNQIPVMPFTATGLDMALTRLKGYAAEECPFNFYTDKSSSKKFKVKTPASIRSRLGGSEGSLLDTYGGEFEFTGYDVWLHSSRGADNGVKILYGKNLIDLNQEESIENTITGICPYWADQDGNLVTLPEKVIESEYADSYPYKRTAPMDFSSDFEEKPTVDQLRTAAQNYVRTAEIGVPDVSIDISFVVLSQFPEYAEYKNIEEVHLCDKVTVRFDRLGINKKAKVVQTVFDVLKDRYDSITLGSIKPNLAKTLAARQSETEEIITEAKEGLALALEKAKNMLSGVDGGYIVDKYTADGHRYEMLIMDTDSEETATNVWRWNQNGFGHATRNAAGELEYNTAILQTGEIDASFITVGSLTADLIKAGVLSSTDGRFYLDMATGSVTMKNVNITGGIINIESDSNKEKQIINLSYGGVNTAFRPNGISTKDSMGRTDMNANGLFLYKADDYSYPRLLVNDNNVAINVAKLNDQILFGNNGLSRIKNAKSNYSYNEDAKITGGFYPAGTTVNPLGTMKSSKPSTVYSLSDKTWTYVGCTITLTKGNWIIFPMVRFAQNDTGFRALEVNTNLNASSHSSDYSANATVGSLTKIFRPIPVEVTEESKAFYLWAYQTSGGSLNVSTSDTSLTAVRVG